MAVEEDPAPEVGTLVSGYVTNVNDKKGCFVRLSTTLTALVYIKDLSDEFVKFPTEAFPIGKWRVIYVYSFTI